jgi:hypothetical protein
VNIALTPSSDGATSSLKNNDFRMDFDFCKLSHMIPAHTLPQHFSKATLPQLVYLTNMSYVDAWHVVGTMHLYKYWSLVRVPPSVGKCDRRNDQRRENDSSKKRFGVSLP